MTMPEPTLKRLAPPEPHPSNFSAVRALARGTPLLLAALLGLGLATGTGRAASTLTWTGGATAAYWTNAANWSPAGSPLSNDVVFCTAGAARLANSLGAPFAINSLTFNENATSPVTVTVSATTPLTNYGGVKVLAGSHTIKGGSQSSAEFVIATNAVTWDIATGCALTNTARTLRVGSNPTITKAGGGLLVISGKNGGSGGLQCTWQLNGGEMLVTGSVGDLGNSANKVTVASGATLKLGKAVVNPVTLNGSGVDGLGALRLVAAGAFSCGATTLASDAAIGVEGGSTLTVGGALAGAFTLTKLGGGILNIPNGFAGPIVVNEGTLGFSGTTGSSLSPSVRLSSGSTLDLAGVPGPFTLNAGQTLSGSGWVQGQAVVAAAGALLVPGGVGTAGTLYFSSDLELQGNSLTFDLASSGTTDQLVLYGGLNLSGDLELGLNLLDGFLPEGTYTLMTFGPLSGAEHVKLKPYRNVSLSVGANSVSIVVGPGGASVANLVWAGTAASHVWDLQTTLDWTAGGVASSYWDGDNVLFDDRAPAGSTILLVTNVAPTSVTFSNQTVNYTLTGPGAIGGATGLTKAGTGSLTLANSGTNNFLGDVNINGGSVIFNRSDDFVENHSLKGVGAVAVESAGTLTLTANNSFSGGLLVNHGTLRLAGPTSGGAGAVTVNSGATLVAGAAQANPLTLSNATFGASVATVNLTGGLTLPANTTNTLCTTDPQDLSVTPNLVFTGPLSGSGNLVVLPGSTTVNAMNTTAACRFDGTNVPGNFSGTITLAQGVKSEIMMAGDQIFSPAGSGKFFLTAGSLVGDGTLDGTYCNLLVRNNTTNDVTFGNDVEIVGSGIALINPVGSSPANTVSTLGNLTLGDGQALGLYTVSGFRGVAFPHVTLKGGTATFTVHPAVFSTGRGADLTLGSISETAPSSIVSDGVRTVSVTGTANYSGSTTVSNGVFCVAGALAGSGPVSVAGGALAGTGTIAGPVTIQGGGTLAPGTLVLPGGPKYGIGTLTLNNSLTLAGNVLMEIDKSASPSHDRVQVSGALNYGGTLTITNSGAEALAAGDQFQLFSPGGHGTFTVLGTPGEGLVWNFNPATGILSVTTPPPPVLGVSRSGQTLSFSWAEAGYKLQAQTNALAKGLSTNWVDYAGGDLSPVDVTMNPADPAVFFRLIRQ